MVRTKRFALILSSAALCGALWEMAHFPLGWLMGAAVAAGAFAAFDVAVSVPGPLHKTSLAVLGASVGLAVTPEVAAAMAGWIPVMLAAAFAGMLAAAAAAPALARIGGMSRSTAFFSLLPGGIIEMADIGERFGADRAVISVLHAARVGLVVGLLPAALFLAAGAEPTPRDEVAPGGWTAALLPVVAAGLLGGWLGSLAGLPAAWLLGAVILVGILSSFGGLPGRVPEELLAAVQVLVGVQLGARFRRSRLAAVPRALMAGLPAILAIMFVMAALSAAAGLAMPFTFSTLALCFSIGGMAEMVLTSKALGQNVALVAAFQAVRGVVVNATAGTLWRWIRPASESSKSSKG